MNRQCGSCGHARRFRIVPEALGAPDRVECRSDDHAKWLDMQNITTRYSSEMKRQGYVNLCRLEKVARQDYECPHWKPKETNPAIESTQRG